MDALSFVKLVVLPFADALREKGVLRLEVDGCKVELAPHQPGAPAEEDDEDREDPEHPAFDPKVKLREYHAKGSQ
jgi:hypothetical protein